MNLYFFLENVPYYVYPSLINTQDLILSKDGCLVTAREVEE